MSKDVRSADAKIGSAAREWESDLGELLDMSGMTTEYVESVLDRGKLGKLPACSITDEQASRVLYAVYRVHEMITGFRERYYTAIDAK